jgi:hypothetical protein
MMDPAEKSRRERTIAALARAGHCDAEIGEYLGGLSRQRIHVLRQRLQVPPGKKPGHRPKKPIDREVLAGVD